MRILLDEQLPRQLAREIPHHSVRTVQQQGWSGMGNGELLRRAAAEGFEVFVTADQNLQFQQNLSGSLLRVIVLAGPSNAIEDLVPLVPAVLQAVLDARPGDVMRVDETRNWRLAPLSARGGYGLSCGAISREAERWRYGLRSTGSAASAAWFFARRWNIPAGKSKSSA